MADVIVAYSTIDPALGAMGVTAFIVEAGTPGVRISRRLEKMGLLKSPMAEVVFEDCAVPVPVRLGQDELRDCYVKSSLDYVQVFGGYGYMTDQEIERDVRDSVASTLYSGTAEIQRNIIAAGLGL